MPPLTPPPIQKYLRSYEQNPDSKVFVPLAEAYRKYGLVDKALQVLKEGIRKHPHYVPAHVVLAQCYYDQQLFEKAYHALVPHKDRGRDNPRLFKLLTLSAMKTNRPAEAQQYAHRLSFLSPHDSEVLSQAPPPGGPPPAPPSFFQEDDLYTQVDQWKAVGHEEGPHDIPMDLARAYLEGGHFSQAQKLVESYQALAPGPAAKAVERLQAWLAQVQRMKDERAPT